MATATNKAGITPTQIQQVFRATAEDNVLNGTEGNIASSIINDHSDEGTQLIVDMIKNGYNPVDFSIGIEVGYNLAKSQQ